MKKKSRGFMLIDTLIVSITVSAILIYLYFQFANINESYTKSFRYNTVEGLYSAYDVKENILTNGLDKIYEDVATNSFVDLTNCSSTYYKNIAYCTTLNESLDVKKVIITTGNLSNIQSLMQQTANINAYDETLRDLIKKTANANVNYQIFVEFNDDTAAVVTHGTIFKVGDYVSMTPTKTSFKTDPSMTGYSEVQTIDPSELNLWRVIKVNGDGTVEMVSEYVSSTEIGFKGTTGYKNYVGYLNIIASQYANPKYTIKTRHMGYDNQTSIIEDTNAFDGTDESNEAPSTTSTPFLTSGTGQEYSGGVLGDTLYLNDYLLVGNAYKSETSTHGSTGLIAYDASATTTAEGYWLASRKYNYYDSADFFFYGRFIDFGGSMNSLYIRYYLGSWSDYARTNRVRPIVTLKSGVIPTDGDGRSAATAWVLE